MDGQVALAGETLPALSAGVRQLARVRAGVEQKLPGRQEGLPAGRAEIILLPSVHLEVSLNACAAKSLSADGAQVGGALVEALMLLE